MNHLRLAVVEVGPEAGSGFAVEVWVDGVEMTRSAAGLGMDPYDLLVPRNRLIPASPPSTIPIARCGCGVYGCGETDVEITRSGDVVTWRWLKEKPGIDSSPFDAAQYLDEVARVGGDFSWETAERTAGRLILDALISRPPLSDDLHPDWLANHWRDPGTFRVCLGHAHRYQIFIDFRWDGRTPEALAADVVAELTRKEPSSWTATWHAIRPGDVPPPLAGPRWSPAELP